MTFNFNHRIIEKDKGVNHILDVVFPFIYPSTLLREFDFLINNYLKKFLNVYSAENFAKTYAWIIDKRDRFHHEIFESPHSLKKWTLSTISRHLKILKKCYCKTVAYAQHSRDTLTEDIIRTRRIIQTQSKDRYLSDTDRIKLIKAKTNANQTVLDFHKRLDFVSKCLILDSIRAVVRNDYIFSRFMGRVQHKKKWIFNRWMCAYYFAAARRVANQPSRINTVYDVAFELILEFIEPTSHLFNHRNYVEKITAQRNTKIHIQT